MPYIIRNTQSALEHKPGTITPSVCCSLGLDGNWTLNGHLMEFAEKSHAEDAIKDSGLNVGRNEYPERNQVNVIEAVEA